ncbi:antibiotic biosynthesis monooxygenase [Kitasatospora sp. NPDC088346]|uniref:antibiotic biosynthesis monooxygenase n=1 Tax=Kitasatospora sp. NPDC088346 TaxID=3364073 RepID=UPI003822E2CA
MAVLEGVESAAGDEVTLFVARRVDAGHEDAFEHWARGILGAASDHPGNLGTGLLRPAEPGAPWHLLLHFRDADSFTAWQRSPARAACFARVDGHHVEVARRELHGMEGWFATTPAGARRTPPARWKMAVDLPRPAGGHPSAPALAVPGLTPAPPAPLTPPAPPPAPPAPPPAPPPVPAPPRAPTSPARRRRPRPPPQPRCPSTASARSLIGPTGRPST